MKLFLENKADLLRMIFLGKYCQIVGQQSSETLSVFLCFAILSKSEKRGAAKPFVAKGLDLTVFWDTCDKVLLLKWS